MKPIEKVIGIMKRLRGDHGCPWDKEQNHESIAACALEEACELADAIASNDMEAMKEELGDLLLQVVFHSVMAEEKGWFDFDDVARGLADKLVLRHPHIFAGLNVEDSAQVLQNWEKIKKKEPGKAGRNSVMDSVPRSLPALVAAIRMQEKAARYGFDWDSSAGIIEKIKEELSEIEDALSSGFPEAVSEEIGDLLFSVVNLARKTGIDPETALRKTNQKFCKRFMAIENEAKKKGIPLSDMSLKQMDSVWERQKESEKGCK